MIGLPDGLHPDYAPSTEATLAALIEVYPAVRLAGLELYDRAGDLSLGQCDNKTIKLNSYWFSQPRSFLDNAVARGRAIEPPEAMPWHGRIGGMDHEFDRLLTHEFGHLLADVTPGTAVFCKAGHAAALAEPALAVSGYALVDPDEWLAETFCALRLGGSGSIQVAAMAGFLLGK